MKNTDDAQLILHQIWDEVTADPSVMVINMWGGPPQEMFLKKHVDARLKPWILQ